MPICKKCNSKFPYIVRIKDRPRNLGNRKYCLTCSPFGQHNTKKLEIPAIPNKKLCKRCNKIKAKTAFYNRSDRTGLYSYCKSCSNKHNRASQKRRGENRKLKLIKMKGSECKICGYNKNYAVLSFHHRNPSSKKYKLDARGLRTITWQKCLLEIKKCDLLCANCHTELHNPRASLT